MVKEEAEKGRKWLRYKYVEGERERDRENDQEKNRQRVKKRERDRRRVRDRQTESEDNKRDCGRKTERWKKLNLTGQGNLKRERNTKESSIKKGKIREHET